MAIEELFVLSCPQFTLKGGALTSSPKKATNCAVNLARKVVPKPLRLHYERPTSRRKKALLIGINYQELGSSFILGDKEYGPLTGSQEDVKAMKTFLIEQWGWPESAVIILMDDASLGSEFQPTEENIIRELQKMASSAEPDDSFFFHFSGHGGQIPDQDGDEEDGQDEVIWTVDQKPIVDDTLHATLVRKLPSRCRLTAVVDSCSSGTVFDLTEGLIIDSSNMIDTAQTLVFTATSPVITTANTLVEPNGCTQSDSVKLAPRADHYAQAPLTAPLYDDKSPNLRRRSSEGHLKPNAPLCMHRRNRSSSFGFSPNILKKYVAAEVVLLAACHDSEESEEVVVNKRKGTRMGAFTKSFIDVMRSGSQHTFRSFWDQISSTMQKYRETVQGHKTRVPSEMQITSSREICWDDRLEL